jgi:hypothetical protein
MNAIPCFRDSQENRFPEGDDIEDESPLSLLEQEIEWICDSWADALEIDTAEEWASVRSEIYGAKQALNRCIGVGHSNARVAFGDLGGIVFELELDCIARGRYEGAPK